jgi:hypothetical protein
MLVTKDTKIGSKIINFFENKVTFLEKAPRKLKKA